MPADDSGWVDLAAVYERHRQKIYRYLLRRSGSAQDAEELTQRVFADAAAALKAGPQPDSVLAWLFTVAERRFVDELRLRSRTAEFVRAFVDVPRPELDYSSAVVHAIRDGIGRLPDDQREVVVMKIFEGRSFAEIATRVSASEAACKMRFSRGVRCLREFLAAEGFKP